MFSIGLVEHSVRAGAPCRPSWISFLSVLFIDLRSGSALSQSRHLGRAQCFHQGCTGFPRRSSCSEAPLDKTTNYVIFCAIMTGRALGTARKNAGWTQARLATLLGVTQAYLSLMERGRRRVPDRLARAVSLVLEMPATELPLEASPDSVAELTNATLVDELAKLDYPGFAYLRNGRATRNPAELLLSALALDDLDARPVEALPWLLLRFDELDVDLVVRRAKLHDLQNRLGFMVALARQVAEHNPSYRHRLRDLRVLERRLEDSRLTREDTFGRRKTTERMRVWLRDHRSDVAKHWNLLTDLKTEHLPYAGHDSAAMAQLPS